MTVLLGCFVVIEGPEGAGKSTLLRELGSRLEMARVKHSLWREPGGTLLAEAARKLVLDPACDPGPQSELFLMLAARADLVSKVIRPRIGAGELVVSDRYDLSTMAYQVGGRGLDEAKVRAANSVATGGLTPDITLVLDIEPGVGAARQAAAGKVADRMELADPEFHRRVNDWYRRATGPEVFHLDASLSPRLVADAAWRALASVRPDIFV